MADLKTTYMGIPLESPIIVGACSLSRRLDTIRQIEAAGAGALVIKSLFEEQVALERGKMEDLLSQYDELYAEAVNLFPKTSPSGAKEHLYWVKEARRAVKIPLIASLNALSDDVWVEYARQLAESGVNGLELNFYSLSLDEKANSSDLEKKELETFHKIRQAVRLPLSVKLHPYYTNLMRTAKSFDEAGANALVLFNRLFQPDIDIEKETERTRLTLSDSRDSMLSLRWIALLHGAIKAELIASTGIMNGNDVVRMILAGANSVQVVSTLYKNKLTQIGKMIEEIETWMAGKNYASLDEFRGHASKKTAKNPWAYERGQYIKALLGFD